MLEILWIALAYVLGSAPWGLVIARTFCGIDPRENGSRNTGATNVARLCGFRWGVATLLCDVLKGAVPVWLAFRINASPVFVSMVALACVLGHVFSCFMKFRGGKAVATSIGIFLPLAFWQLLASSLLCTLVIWRSGFVSLGSLTLVTALPVALAVSGQWVWLPLALGVWAVVVWKHRENIVRLRSGTEKSWLKSKNKGETAGNAVQGDAAQNTSAQDAGRKDG
ncbi:glycerol-3-phosphate 1-O-acyltransferase PlsY [Desulfovibrio sp.]|uniref:glycerol-3-phosphate 1-O-acyltransferase PlsY n=1 Tax=Desulfovibrio sp. TaxID=885 RepID=UPI0025C6DF02|nr:glycerol-3-phosphate 1-O-acyltransferase PlsY [Desulfovibrio sp.]